MTKEIKKISKKSLAKVISLIYGLVGFFTAMIIAVSTMANIVTQRDFQGSVLLVTLFNVGAGLLLGVVSALLTAAIGWIMGYLLAAIYNWFARKVGGVRIELEDVVEKKEEVKIEN